MMGNRFVGFFETTVTSWKAKLAATRSTLDVWLEVSRSWMQLESIFLASEDIREQLPEDAKRFDANDAAFREQMTDACQNNDRRVPEQRSDRGVHAVGARGSLQEEL